MDRKRLCCSYPHCNFTDYLSYIKSIMQKCEHFNYNLIKNIGHFGKSMDSSIDRPLHEQDNILVAKTAEPK